MKNAKKILALICLLLVCATVTQFASCALPVRAENLMAGITPNAIVIGTDDFGGSENATDFAVRLLRAARTEGKNVSLAPLSVLCALALTANGAQGATRAQMEEMLGMKIEQLNLYLYSYINTLSEGEKYHLRLANSVWFTDSGDLTVKPDFLQIGADYYGADAYKAPFNRRTLNDINHWVKEKTEGMIPKTLDSISPDAVMYLINTLAFEAEWEEIYEKRQVREGLFTKEDGSTQKVDLMYSTEGKYLDDGNATGFIKYYNGRKYAFAALLPNEGMTVDEYIDTLNGATLHSLLRNAEISTVKAAIPKFETEYEAELSAALSSMGMIDAFHVEDADFSGIGTMEAQNIYIGSVIHKTFIGVGERGTRAGAVTVVQLDGASDGPSRPHEVFLDRPFVYMLIDCENHVPFFVGTIMDVGHSAR